MLERDVGNIAAYFGQFAPELKYTRYAKEMWARYEEGSLTPETRLTGQFAEPEDAADLDAVMREIKAALAEEARRQALLAGQDEPAGREEPTPPWMRA
jgi:RIO kinase 1